ncbi:DUF1146 domain-containing protein [Sporolactobacillus sp. THM7-7]|nr:DUF1146 domain-containing protein [Sporolactobacillus sp. THM7-7]
MLMNDGFYALLSLFIHLIALILTWWALQSLKIDVFMRRPKSLQSRILLILIALAISYPVARFFLDYMDWSLRLPQIYG